MTSSPTLPTLPQRQQAAIRCGLTACAHDEGYVRPEDDFCIDSTDEPSAGERSGAGDNGQRPPRPILRNEVHRLTDEDVRLPRRSTLVLNNPRPEGAGDMTAIEQHFARHHLEERVVPPYDQRLRVMLDQGIVTHPARLCRWRPPAERVPSLDPTQWVVDGFVFPSRTAMPA